MVEKVELNDHRKNILELFQKIVYYDFPNKWNELVDILKQLLSSQSIKIIVATFYCFNHIFKNYQYSIDEDREPIDGLLCTFGEKFIQCLENAVISTCDKSKYNNFDFSISQDTAIVMTLLTKI